MQKEAKKVMNLIEGAIPIFQKMFPNSKIAVYPNKYLQEGINVEIDKNTMVCQTNPESTNIQFLSLAIYKNQRFDPTTGTPIDDKGAPTTFKIDDKLKKHIMYGMDGYSGNPSWSELNKKEGNWDSKAIADLWIKSYIDIVRN